MYSPVPWFSDWGPFFYVITERRKRDGTMDESHTGNRISDICFILSFAPARNEACRDT